MPTYCSDDLLTSQKSIWKPEKLDYIKLSCDKVYQEHTLER